MAKIPKYCLHKPTGQAYVRLPPSTKPVYLGRYGSVESRQRYDSEIASLLARRSEQSPPVELPASGSVDSLIIAWTKAHADYYVKNNKPTGEAAAYRTILTTLSQTYGGSPIDQFGPKRLTSVRQQWIDHGYARMTINGMVRAI